MTTTTTTIEWRRCLTLMVGATLIALSACSSTSGNEAAVERGAAVVREFGCLGCHSTDATAGNGPGWGGIWGTERELADGRTVMVDEEYLWRSIVDPTADVVAGFAPTMPIFPLTDEEIEDLTAYLREVSGG